MDLKMLEFVHYSRSGLPAIYERVKMKNMLDNTGK